MNDEQRSEIRKILNKLFELLMTSGCETADTFEIHLRVEEALLNAERKRVSDADGEDGGEKVN